MFLIWGPDVVALLRKLIEFPLHLLLSQFELSVQQLSVKLA